MTDRQPSSGGANLDDPSNAAAATASDAVAAHPSSSSDDRTRTTGGVAETNGDAELPLAIETSSLVKHFGETKAVDGVDLAVPTGGIYGLLGPNGAGKTTVIRLLATLLRPTEGSATVLGDDVVDEAGDVRRRVSLTGQFASIDEDLTGRENLVLLARLLGYSRRGASDRARELLEAFGLSDAAKRQVKTYSGGMARRLDIAASIVVTPDLLFLDEPTTGLDPRNRNQVWDIIRVLVDNGTTVLLTTQYLDEADVLADRIAVIDAGRIIAEGTPGELKASVGSGTLSVRVRNPQTRATAQRLLTATLDTPVELESDPTALSVRVSDDEDAVAAFTELSRSDVDVTDFALGQPSLDEVFLALTDRRATDGGGGGDGSDGDDNSDTDNGGDGANGGNSTNGGNSR